MATRDLTYLIQFDTDPGGIDQAADDVERLAETLDDLSGSPVEIGVEVEDLSEASDEMERINEALDDIARNADVAIDVDSRDLDDAADQAEDLTDAIRRVERQRTRLSIDGTDAERAASDVMELQAELDRFNREDFILEMQVDLEESEAKLRELADQLQELEEFDLPGVREGVLAEYQEVEQRIEGLKQDLADVSQPVDVPVNVTGNGVEGVERISQGAGRASEGMRQLGRSSDQTRSVMANLTGNAAQDLAELGGVSGSTGIAISQLAEYAADGNVSLSNFAKLAGPMAGISAGIWAATTAFDAFRSKGELAAATTEATSEAMAEASGYAEDLKESLEAIMDAAQAAGDPIAQFGAALQQGLVNEDNVEEIAKINRALVELGLSTEDLGPAIITISGEVDALSGAFDAGASSFDEFAGLVSGAADMLRDAGVDEYADEIALAVLTTDDLGRAQDELSQILFNSGQVTEDAAGKAAELMETYRSQAAALEQLDDAHENNRLNDFAEAQLDLAAASDLATAALIGQIEAANPDFTQFQVWAELVRQTSETTAATIGEINNIIAEGREAAAAEAEAWNILVQDMADGSLEAHNAATAWNILRDEMGYTDDQIRELLESKVADHLEDIADEALSAADAFDEWSRSQRTFDDFPVALEAVMKHIRNGTTDTEAFATAFGVLERAFPDMTRADIFAELADRIDEANQKGGEFADMAKYDLAAAAEEAAERLQGLQDAVGDVAGSLEDVADRGDAFSTAIGRFAQWGDLGQIQETLTFADALDRLGDAVDDLVDSDVNLSGLELIPDLDNWSAIRDMPEEVRAVVDALAGFAGSVHEEMAQAFDSGGSEAAIQWAANTRQAIVDELVQAGLDVEENAALIEEILTELGVSEAQVEIFIQIANEERARGVLDALQGQIDELPDEVQLQIAAVAATDPIAALQLALDALAAEGVEIPVELIALMDELNGDIEGYEPPTVEVPAKLKSEEVVAEIAGLQEKADDNPVTVKGDADLSASESAVEEFIGADRTVSLYFGFKNTGPARQTIDNVAADRTVTLTAEAHTLNAGIALDDVAEDRTVAINAFLRQFPTKQEIINRITGGSGVIRIPVDTYPRNIARVSGQRPV